KIMARKEGCTLYMVLLALTNILLSKLANQEDIVIGTPVAGRHHADLQQVIGMFVNTLALRNYPRGEKPVIEFLRDLKKNTLDAFENQEYPFEDLVERIEVNRDTARNPLFDVMLVMQNFDDRPSQSPGVRQSLHWHENILRQAKFDITLIAAEVGDRLRIYLEYCIKLFKKETIAGFICYFNKILSSMVQPGIKIGEIEIISEENKKQILSDFNSTSSVYPKDKTIQQLFEEQVEKTPDYIAVIAHSPRGTAQHREKHHAPGPGPGDQGITYRELNQKSHHLALLLMSKGIGPDRIVGLMTEASIEMAVGLLASLKAGGAYLPINPGYPGARKKYLLIDARIDLLLTDCEDAGKYVADGVREVISPGDFHPNIGNNDHRPLTNRCSPDNLAYIIYTSGSTGGPKGVMVDHGNVIRLVKNTNYLRFKEIDRILQTGALEFDASTFEIWGALLNGLELHLASKDITLVPEK
ncbi:MAG: AMP-binding protein, partial [Candidatus Aminicenantes bacterium]